jgi:tetraacyldisaccharide 4'-kinase
MAPHPALPSWLSAPAAAGYHIVQRVHEKAYSWGILRGERLAVPVISVGNILLGGSGKTPFVAYLAELLRTRGFKPGVVSRGYRGTNREPFLVVGDPSTREPPVGPSECGDEPFLLARRLPAVPVLVGRRRVLPAAAAVRLFGCDVIILDDGFQHLSLARDADIVLLNGLEDRMFPRGSLREPFSALKRADVIILAGEEAAIAQDAMPFVSGKPVFRCRQVPERIEKGGGDAGFLLPGEYKGRDVVLVSAIAHPERFRKTAESLRWHVADHLIFRDHHVFTERDLRSIPAGAGRMPVIFTEKDWVKLPAWFRADERVGALAIRMVVDEEEAFLKILMGLLAGTRGR